MQAKIYNISKENMKGRCCMVTKEQIDILEQQTNEYFMKSRKVGLEIENRQEELDGILLAYKGMNDTSAQVLRHYFLNGGKVR